MPYRHLFGLYWTTAICFKGECDPFACFVAYSCLRDLSGSRGRAALTLTAVESLDGLLKELTIEGYNSLGCAYDIVNTVQGKFSSCSDNAKDLEYCIHRVMD